MDLRKIMENKLEDYDEMTAIQLQMSQENEKQEGEKNVSHHGREEKRIFFDGDMKELSQEIGS